MEAAESLGKILAALAVMIAKFWLIISELIFPAKIEIGMLMLVMVLLYRIAMANFLYVKRHDKRDWIVWGVLLTFQIATIFVAVPWIWLLAQCVIIVFMISNAIFSDKIKQVKTTIYSNNIVYEDNSDRFDNNKDSDVKNAEKSRDGKIRRSFSLSRRHLKMGIPVLVNKFTFKVGVMATEEQLAKTISCLNKYYDEYNWRRQKSPNGIKYEFTAEIKTKRNMIINFDKDLSDTLDWCVVPLGAIDVSSESAAADTPYVWMMHDPKTEGKEYKRLAKTKLYYPSPHAFIIGQTGGGKSVLVNNMIAHWVNKAKTSRQVDLYLCDAKRVEFGPYACLEEVRGVAMDLDSAVELSTEFCKEMHRRNAMMEKEGMKSIPLDGKVTLKRTININGEIIPGNEIIEFKTKDGKIRKDKAMRLKDRDDIIEVNLPDDEEEEKDDDRGGLW